MVYESSFTVSVRPELNLDRGMLDMECIPFELGDSCSFHNKHNDRVIPLPEFHRAVFIGSYIRLQGMSSF